MKKTIFTLVTLLLGSILYAQNKEDIVGVWLSETKDGKFQIYEEGGLFFGKLIWMKEEFEKDGKTPKKDVNNPNKSFRNKPLKGSVILKKLKYHKGEWKNGEIYDPQSGKTYHCKAKIKNNQLILRGFVGVSLLGKNTTWTRVES
ncbi:hypothetical protein CAPN006_06860 [Capnocytophaga canimorsus]|uniref:DUF2147 domain-containing protein n=1 Tax=Capnocytophaga canimorsus TaxID=28188 RepID=UPI001AD5AC6E|nr:DUF2147 domain-containing protein [Capnocytophaga canimorsus]GIM56292.1 hypothetical protein CAPN006_06860 [Capnocytophaga canimorsus]